MSLGAWSGSILVSTRTCTRQEWMLSLLAVAVALRELGYPVGVSALLERHDQEDRPLPEPGAVSAGCRHPDRVAAVSVGSRLPAALVGPSDGVSADARAVRPYLCRAPGPGPPCGGLLLVSREPALSCQALGPPEVPDRACIDSACLRGGRGQPGSLARRPGPPRARGRSRRHLCTGRARAAAPGSGAVRHGHFACAFVPPRDPRRLVLRHVREVTPATLRNARLRDLRFGCGPLSPVGAVHGA